MFISQLGDGAVKGCIVSGNVFRNGSNPIYFESCTESGSNQYIWITVMTNAYIVGKNEKTGKPVFGRDTHDVLIIEKSSTKWMYDLCKTIVDYEPILVFGKEKQKNEKLEDGSEIVRKYVEAESVIFPDRLAATIAGNLSKMQDMISVAQRRDKQRMDEEARKRERRKRREERRNDKQNQKANRKDDEYDF